MRFRKKQVFFKFLSSLVTSQTTSKSLHVWNVTYVTSNILINLIDLYIINKIINSNKGVYNFVNNILIHINYMNYDTKYLSSFREGLGHLSVWSLL